MFYQLVCQVSSLHLQLSYSYNSLLLHYLGCPCPSGISVLFRGGKNQTKEKAETSVLRILICTRVFKHGNIWSKRQLTPVKKLGNYCSLTSAQKTTITWGRFCKRDVVECSCRPVSSYAHMQGNGHWKCPFIMGQEFVYFYSFYSCNLPIAVLLNPV